ncbi:MAG: NAD(P)H-hydrate epimerase, partial [Proteobacteria bacterium]|nr:NAD(P)H-hydrate epimerase [Pseudomonadota bacterium]
MAALDANTIASGVSARQLMERAGRAVLKASCERYSRLSLSESRSIILCGAGNNGGDGLVVARILREHGGNPTVVITSADRYSQQHQEQLSLYCSEGGTAYLLGGIPECLASAPFVKVLRELTLENLAEQLARSEFIFDALLGIGQQSAPRTPVADIVQLALATQAGTAKIISVDIPTGVNADTGQTYEPHIRADLTVAIGFIKRGMVQSPAIEACGEVATVDIGISLSKPVEFSALTRSTLPSFPNRSRDAHKGNAGRVLVIGGSLAMPGAPLLSALGALRTGAGIVVVTRLDSSAKVLRAAELIDLPLLGDVLCADHLGDIHAALTAADAIVVGPGIGRAGSTQTFIQKLLPELRSRGVKVVIDADALNLLAELGVPELGPLFVITPHPGEAARLLGCDPQHVQADRYSAVRSLT